MQLETKNSLLKGRGLVRRAKTETILNDVNITINEDDFTVLMGTSGAGKTTLLTVLSGLDRLDEGEVCYRGQRIDTLSEAQSAKLRGREFGFIFQQTHLVSNLTLLENVMIAGYLCGKYQPEAVEPQARALLKRMGVDAIRHHRPSEISGGEGQRAAIARAVIAKPGIIFADEPTGALNRSSSLEVLDLLTELNRQGQSLVMVTHDVAAAVRGNRILYVEEGQLVMEKTLPHYDTQYDHQRQKEISDWLIERNW